MTVAQNMNHRLLVKPTSRDFKNPMKNEWLNNGGLKIGGDFRKVTIPILQVSEKHIRAQI